MSHTETTISRPVSVTDVQAVLGTTAQSVGALCRSVSVNKWSRYKPIRDPRPSLDLSVGEGYRGNAETLPDGQSVERNCGLAVVAHANIADLLDDSKTAYDWRYLRPTGKRRLDGSAAPATLFTPYRLGDFDKYSHVAASPLGGELQAPSAIPNDAGTQFSVNLAITRIPAATDPTQPGSLTAAELGLQGGLTIADCYFGIAIFAQRGGALTLMWARTASVPGGSSLTAAGVPSLTNGETVTLVPFMATKAMTDGAALSDTTIHFVSLPDAPAVTVKVGNATAARGITLNIRPSTVPNIAGTAYLTTYTATVTVAADGTGGTFSDCVVNLYDNDNNIIGQHLLGDITVPAGQSYSHNGTFNTATKPVRIELSIHGGVYSISSYIRQTAEPGEITLQ